MNSESVRKSKNQNGSYCLEEDLPISSPILFAPHTKEKESTHTQEKESTAQHARSLSTQVEDLMHEQIDNPKFGDHSLS